MSTPVDFKLELETRRTFPIQISWRREEQEAYRGPRSVPWSLVAPHEAQAQCNHGQSLQRLAERHGLCPSELVAVLEDRPWRSMSTEAAVARLLEIIAERDAS